MSSSFVLWSTILTLCFVSFFSVNLFMHQRESSHYNKPSTNGHGNIIKEQFLDFKKSKKKNSIHKIRGGNKDIIEGSSTTDAHELYHSNTNNNKPRLGNSNSNSNSNSNIIVDNNKPILNTNLQQHQLHQQDKEKIEQHQDQPKRTTVINTKQDKISTTTTKTANKETTLAGLSCAKYGGPNDDDEAVKEMVYWNDVPSDAKHKSPFYDKNKYISFEPDNGGWNNIRMSMETILVLAHATGRTLVLPPPQRFYLLNSKSTGKSKSSFSFEDFFHMDSIAKEHPGLDIITMEEFLSNVIMKERLIDNKNGSKPLRKPPYNKVDWSITEGRKSTELWDYLRDIGEFPLEKWEPWECLATIPSSDQESDVTELENIMAEINAVKPLILPTDYIGKPVPVNSTAKERLKENLGERKKLCIYDKTLQNLPLMHIYEKTDASRFLAPFYSFIFFQNYKVDLWIKRFIRDHVRYIDEIMCAGARVIQALRKKSISNGKEGEYHSIHVRRGDFQYKPTRLPAEKLLAHSQNYFTKDSIIYIATDERDKSFFQPFVDYYKAVYYLDDFLDVITKDININYYGMLDQIVASRSSYFIGTWWSTFSSYINRMRAYHVTKGHQKNNTKQDGIIDSWYFDPDGPYDRKNEMRVYHPIRKPLYMREFPTSWKDIDNGFDIVL